MKKIKRFFLSILPGIFIIGYNVGTGSISSMSKAGANFGLDLLWTVLFSCVITYYLLLLFSRYTMATEETVIQGMKSHISPTLTIFLIGSLSFIIFIALIGVLGVVAEVLEVGSEALFDQPVDAKWWAILTGGILYALLWVGNFDLFEKVLAFLVALMGIAFLLCAVLHFPSLTDIVQGLMPGVPEEAVGSDNSPGVIVASMVGTTVSVFTLIIRSQTIDETDWDMDDYKIQRRDAAISAGMMFVLSAAIIITASTTLHARGMEMNKVSEMVLLLEPVMGQATLAVLVVGIVAAGLSSHIPNLLIIPWLLIDYWDMERDTQTPLFRTILFVLTLISVIGVVFGLKPVFILLLSQALIAILLPLTIGAVYYLTSREKLMKQHVNTAMDHVFLIAIMGFTLFMSYNGVKGAIVDIKPIILDIMG